MEKFTLVTMVKGTLSNAGPKAPLDICRILEAAGGVYTITFSTNKGEDLHSFLKLMIGLYKIKKENNKIVLQYPIQPYNYHKNLNYFRLLKFFLPKDKTTVFVHDINSLRFKQFPVYRQEMKLLSGFNDFIVHNDKMKNYLQTRIPHAAYQKIEMFDYLCKSNQLPSHTNMFHTGNPVITYAGNLERSKAAFLYHLEENKMQFLLNLYGVRTSLFQNRKIRYRGRFAADLLPDRLVGDLGLIWDSEIDARNDKTAQREYTRYNTPHKLSCYLAAGIPVIAWKEAAVAELIQKYEIGYLIENIYEINELNYDNYAVCKENAQKLGAQIRSGYFTKKVFGLDT